MYFKYIIFLIALSCINYGEQEANASGFVVARFGGEHGHPTSDNLSAIYYNPAALTLGSGTRLMIDGTFAHRGVTYTRPESAISNLGTGTPNDIAFANAGTANLSNFATAPFISFASDFGVPNLAVAFGVYAPFGGGASWDKNSQVSDAQSLLYPGAQDGQQRWWSIDSSLKSIYMTLGLAYKLSEQFSFGLSVNRVSTSIDTVRARTVPAPDTDDIVNENGVPVEGRSYLNASSDDFSVGLGILYQPSALFRIGYSYQSQPGFGEIRLEGDLKVTDHLSVNDPQASALVMSLPDIHRLGVQYGGVTQGWEARLFVDYVSWSVFDRQCVLSDPKGKCDLEDPTAPITLNINKNWQNAFGIRLGGSYWLSEHAEMYVGTGYDSNAAPDLGVDPSLFDMDKFSAALGVRLNMSSLRLGMTLI
jgi:long-chain fatty acid transport protein